MEKSAAPTITIVTPCLNAAATLPLAPNLSAAIRSAVAPG